MIDEPSKVDAAKNAEPSLVVKRSSTKQIVNAEEAKTHFAQWLLEQSKVHRDKRQTQVQYSERYGVSQVTLSQWRYRDRQFNDILKRLLPDSLLQNAPEVYADIARRAEFGDPQMKKLYLQQAKLLEAEKHETKSLNVNVDVQGVPRPKA